MCGMSVIYQAVSVRPRPNIISRLKVFLVKESTRIKIILIASYFFNKIELATIDIHYSYRTVQLVHKPKASCDWVIIFGDVYYFLTKSLLSEIKNFRQFNLTFFVILRDAYINKIFVGNKSIHRNFLGINFEKVVLKRKF